MNKLDKMLPWLNSILLHVDFDQIFHASVSKNKGKYFGQKLLFLPPPKMKIYLFLPCFPATKNSQSCKVRPRLARSAENFEYLVLILAKMIINGRKTGKKRPNRAKTGRILGFHFHFKLDFFFVFWNLIPPWGRGRGGYGQYIYPCQIRMFWSWVDVFRWFLRNIFHFQFLAMSY